MKIAILSDIHGNLPALQAVAGRLEQWRPDRVIVAGDMVNRGPQSAACWQFAQQRAKNEGWLLLQGNHEEYVLNSQAKRHREGPELELARISRWTCGQMKGAVAALAALPEGRSLDGPDGRELRVRHASMQHNRDGLYPDTADAAIEAQIAPPPALFATAHTHWPFVRQIKDTLVVNAGSVGTPADGDRRASYAQVWWQDGRWQAHIARVPYDWAQTRHDYYSSGLLAEGGPLAWLIYYEWQRAAYFFPGWMARYWEVVVGGQLEIETAVRQYLQQHSLPVPV